MNRESVYKKRLVDSTAAFSRAADLIPDTWRSEYEAKLLQITGLVEEIRQFGKADLRKRWIYERVINWEISMNDEAQMNGEAMYLLGAERVEHDLLQSAEMFLTMDERKRLAEQLKGDSEDLDLTTMRHKVSEPHWNYQDLMLLLRISYATERFDEEVIPLLEDDPSVLLADSYGGSADGFQEITSLLEESFRIYDPDTDLDLDEPWVKTYERKDLTLKEKALIILGAMEEQQRPEEQQRGDDPRFSEDDHLMTAQTEHNIELTAREAMPEDFKEEYSQLDRRLMQQFYNITFPFSEKEELYSTIKPRVYRLEELKGEQATMEGCAMYVLGAKERFQEVVHLLMELSPERIRQAFNDSGKQTTSDRDISGKTVSLPLIPKEVFLQRRAVSTRLPVKDMMVILRAHDAKEDLVRIGKIIFGNPIVPNAYGKGILCDLANVFLLIRNISPLYDYHMDLDLQEFYVYLTNHSIREELRASKLLGIPIKQWMVW